MPTIKILKNAPQTFECGYFTEFSVQNNPTIGIIDTEPFRVDHYPNSYSTQNNNNIGYNCVLLVSDGNVDPVNRQYRYIKQFYESAQQMSDQSDDDKKYKIQLMIEQTRDVLNIDQYIFTPTLSSQPDNFDFTLVRNGLITFNVDIVQQLANDLRNFGGEIGEQLQQSENGEGRWFVKVSFLACDFDSDDVDETWVREKYYTLYNFANGHCFDHTATEFWELYKTSDTPILPPYRLITKITFYKAIGGLQRLRQGFFFPYVLQSKYKIFKPLFEMFQCYCEDEVDAIKTVDDCFVWSMTHQPGQSDLFDENEINYLKMKIGGTGLTFKKIEEISTELKTTINIVKSQYVERDDINQSVRSKTVTYKPKGVESIRTVNIGYIASEKTLIPHYFPLIPITFSKSAIQNLETLINKFPLLEPMKLLALRKVNGRNEWNEDSRIKPSNSFAFLKYCIKFNIVRPMQFKDKIRLCSEIRRKNYEYVLDTSIDSFQQKYEPEDKSKDKEEDCVYFADTEAITVGLKHQCYCICMSSYDGNDVRNFYGLECIQEFLQYLFGLKKNITVYFHNLKYDGTLLLEYLYVTQLIKKNGKIYQLECVENGMKHHQKLQNSSNKHCHVNVVTFKDSLCLISMPIKNFNSAFHLGVNEEKEIFPYCAVTPDTLEKCKIENCWKNETPSWNDEKIFQFTSNLQRLGMVVDENYWNVKDYTIYYCNRDVSILRDGFKKFREMTLELLDIDILNCLTASGLAQKYMEKNVYSKFECYKLGGMLNAFVRKACYGGRCMTRKNEKWITEGRMCDYDACSLYPSAMNRLLLPTGKCYPMLNQKIEWYLEHLMDEQQKEPTEDKFISYFVCKIRITKIHQHLEFPLICVRREELNEYIDIDYLSENPDHFVYEMYVDSIYLSDLIKYQGIEFENCTDQNKYTEGVYWRGEKTSIMSDTIKTIYDQRVELKKQKNPAQEVLKLIMNSSYGKCIQKPIETKQSFFTSKRDAEVHMCNYYNVLKCCDFINEHCYMVEDFYNDENWTMTHIGCMVLSMSKRIMNEVFYAARLSNCRIYYQDTDSIHIPESDLPKLEESYRNIYNRQLTGKNMGQFHVDFEPVNGDDNVVSIQTIVCGKKCYLDVLQNSRGDIGYHSRMKGISESCVNGTAELYGGLVPLYKKLYQHPEEKICFNLAKYSPQFKFEINAIISLHDFPRELSFHGKINNLELI